MNGYVNAAQIHQLADAMVSGGLTTEDARRPALQHSPRLRRFAARRSNVLDQLTSDVNELNAVPYLVGGEEDGDQRLISTLNTLNQTPKLISGELPMRTLLFNAVENSKHFAQSAELQEYLMRLPDT